MSPAVVRLAMIAAEEADRTFYAGFFDSLVDVRCETYASLSDFRRQAGTRLYNGLVLDIRAVIRASVEEKDFFYALARSFPLMRVRRLADERLFAGFVESRNLGHLTGQALVSAFVDETCRVAAPRGIRRAIRRAIHLCILWQAGDGGGPERRAVLGNLSSGGGFILSCDDFDSVERLRLVVPEWPDPTPIDCRICWRRPWSPQMRYLPGVGVSFDRISEVQQGELQRMLG